MNNIQWYPGHMAKAKREIKEILRFVDIAVVVGDARLPFSSFNPDINEIIGNKPFIYALNKTDLVKSKELRAWISLYKTKDIVAIPICATDNSNFLELKKAINNRFQGEKKKKNTIRILVAGYPNTGKSAFINKFAGRASMEVKNYAGVTKKQQWIKVREEKQSYDLLDTPGVLPPKFETPEQGEKLAWISAIKEDILDKAEISINL